MDMLLLILLLVMSSKWHCYLNPRSAEECVLFRAMLARFSNPVVTSEARAGKLQPERPVRRLEKHYQTVRFVGK